MEIKVRSLEEHTVCVLNGLARAQGKSRNQYLKEQLTLLAEFPLLQEREDRYQTLVKQLTRIIQENTQLMEELLRILPKERSKKSWKVE